jgi:hypothetical protein
MCSHKELENIVLICHQDSEFQKPLMKLHWSKFLQIMHASASARVRAPESGDDRAAAGGAADESESKGDIIRVSR